MRHRYLRRLVAAGLFLVLLGLGFWAGIGYAHYRSERSADAIIRQVVNRDQSENGITEAIDFGLFWQVWDRLHERYVDPADLDSQKLVYGAINGMVDAVGDPYTVFFEPQPAKEFKEEVSGAFSGVGMEIDKRNDQIVVIAPLKNSPAMQAGVRAGDQITAVDGQSTATMSVEEAVNHIRGKRGTTVIITLVRDGGKPFAVSIVRDTIHIPAVEWRMLEQNIAYLQLYSFNANASDEFAQAVQEITDQGAKKLILDLRNNPGGLLDASVDIAGWMLPRDSLVVQERDQTGIVAQLRTQGGAQLANLPTVILMNGGSASAAEILAGALHDNRNLRLIGEKSFGKGSVQQLEEFYNGSSLKVTVAAWLTPKGINIHEAGIAPTDTLILNPDDPHADEWRLGEPGKDPQLDRAITIVDSLM